MSTAPRPSDRPDDRVSVPFHHVELAEEDIARVVDVLRSGWWTTGPACRAFEQAFADRLGPHVDAVAVNSGTAALHLAVESLGLGPGDLVLTTPYTFTATAEVLRYVGADPVFVDVDPTTGNLTPDGVERAQGVLSARDRAQVRGLLPVHFAGLPCDMAGLTALADAYGWWVVDDAAHALPADHGGRPVGLHGDATAFSFYATKPLATGEGGMVVTRDPALAARMRVMRLHGIDRDAFDRHHVADHWYYEVVAAGFKYNLTDIAAALGLGQLRRQEAHRARRAHVAATYSAAFADVDGLSLPPDADPGDRHAWHLYALRVRDGREVRDQVVRELARLGVTTSVHFIPLHLQPYYRDRYGLRPEDFPGATQLFAGELSLPLFPGITDAQVQAVVEAVPLALERARGAVATTRRRASTPDVAPPSVAAARSGT